MLSVSSLSGKGFFCFKLFQALSKTDAIHTIPTIKAKEADYSPQTSNNAFA
jgi:hypothetical protein